MSEAVKLLVVGCGSRGFAYSRFAKTFPERAKIVGLAEPREFYRNKLGDEFQVPMERRYASWEELAAQPKFADAVMICTSDSMHEEPAIAFAAKHYHMLLEKPMAPTEQGCRNIVKAVKAANIIFAVCHVLRYTAYTRKIKELIQAGLIGEVVNIQQVEPVGYWHQAHAFVRGNWRNEQESSFMLLQKCCHYIDWCRYIMDVPCQEIQSFGHLKHFKKANQPRGAADRCTSCPPEIEAVCPYSALKFYLRDRVIKYPEAQGHYGWPVNVITSDLTPQGVIEALKTGPYGRCVYACDNDVVDNQVVNMDFAGERTASLTMTGFSTFGIARENRIFGTRGMIDSEGKIIHVYDFLSDTVRDFDFGVATGGGIMTGHGGGDGGLMEAFISAIEKNDPSLIVSSADETLESHLMVFAAEKSRHNHQVCKIEQA